MPMQMCSKGHFYNPEIHAACPTCSEDEAFSTETTAVFKMPAGFDQPGRKTEFIAPADDDQQVVLSRKTEYISSGNDDNQELAAQKTEYLPTSNQSPDPRAMPISSSGTRQATRELPEFPVAGWLIITQGPGRGTDFRLIQGENRIGRHEALEISLDFADNSDLTISRDTHAIVIYDNNANEFFVERGGSRTLPMLNGKTIRSDQNLKFGDTLQIGETKLLFIPLCGDSFHW